LLGLLRGTWEKVVIKFKVDDLKPTTYI